MKRFLIKFIVLFFIFSCSVLVQKRNTKCNCEDAIQKSKRDFLKRNYILDNYYINSNCDSTKIKVTFELKEIFQEGGGAYYEIDPTNCEITEKKYFQ